MKTAVIKTTDTITVITEGGKPFQVARSSEFYEELSQAVRDQDDERIDEIVNRSQRLAERFAKFGRVEVFNGHVTVDGNTVNSYLVSRILEARTEGDPIEPLANFLANVMMNPSMRAVEDLYKFLEKAEMPITPDGCFMAFKGVRQNWRDHHSNSFDNSVGNVVKMPRNQVDEDINRTCSKGLHACGPHYLTKSGYSSHFGGDRIILVKINPADVVAFPNDYQNQKLRCCRYVVHSEVTGADLDAFFKDTAIYR